MFSRKKNHDSIAGMPERERSGGGAWLLKVFCRTVNPIPTGGRGESSHHQTNALSIYFSYYVGKESYKCK